MNDEKSKLLNNQKSKLNNTSSGLTGKPQKINKTPENMINSKRALGTPTKNKQALSKTAKVAGVGMKTAGATANAAGKGMKGIGNALSSTGVGAALGAPLAALGAIASGAGKGAKVAGEGAKTAGDTIKGFGNKTSEGMGEKALKVALKVMLKVGLKIILLLGALLLGAFLILALLLVVLFIPILILDSLGLTSIFGGKIKFNLNTNESSISYSENTYLQKVNNDCKTIVVDNQVYSLEDYVKGVVSAEAYTGEGIEALKAQAIAARTFAIKRTDNCTSSIENSSVTQNFTSNFVDSAVEATEATKGLVLTYNSKLIMAQYDSFYTGGDYDCDDNGCSVTYTKLPNNETHKVTVSNDYKRYIAGGHGRGMSQVASYQLAKEGKKFDYILNYFYSPDVQISSLNGSGGYTSGLSAGANGFTKRTGAPSSNNSHDVEFYYSNNNISYKSNNDLVGQCTWYAVGRANEILSAANSELRLERALHAKDWYQDNIDQGANAFSYSPNVNEPKVGAIIVWSSDEFGHVAVVEAVNDDGTIDYSEANISTVKNDSNPYGFRYQSNVSYTGTGEGTISNIWQGYSFVGYIYVIE